MATIRDVSKAAKVSKSTVSRYIAKNGYVSDATREAVEKAIRELGYRPNKTARGLRSSRNNIIGSVVTNLTNYHSRLIGGIQQACRVAGKGLLLGSGFGDPNEEEWAVLDLIDRSCDGLLLNIEFPLSAVARDALERSKIPVIIVGSGKVGPAVGSVVLDNAGGAREAMRFLLAAGHRRIVHIAGFPEHNDTQERIAGAELALAEVGMTLDDIIVRNGDFAEDHGYRTVDELLADGTAFTAIFAGDDDIAAGAYLRLKQEGIAIPQDVSVVGFDDSFHARHLTPALTSVRQPIESAGKLAVETLLQVLEGHPPGMTDVVVPTQLIVRDSVAAAADG